MCREFKSSLLCQRHYSGPCYLQILLQVLSCIMLWLFSSLF